MPPLALAGSRPPRLSRFDPHCFHCFSRCSLHCFHCSCAGEFLVALSRPCIVIGGNFPLQIDCISARERMRGHDGEGSDGGRLGRTTELQNSKTNLTGITAIISEGWRL